MGSGKISDGYPIDTGEISDTYRDLVKVQQ
jgi:hypothetical protein